MQTLEQIIDHSRESRELKRALAVKMSQPKIRHQDIAKFLQISASFISKWCLIYSESMIDGHVKSQKIWIQLKYDLFNRF